MCPYVALLLYVWVSFGLGVVVGGEGEQREAMRRREPWNPNAIRVIEGRTVRYRSVLWCSVEPTRRTRCGLSSRWTLSTTVRFNPRPCCNCLLFCTLFCVSWFRALGQRRT
jgi:hypothetical protein